MSKYSTPYRSYGPLHDRRAAERDIWDKQVRTIATQLPPLTPARVRIIRHPVTGDWVEVR